MAHELLFAGVRLALRRDERGSRIAAMTYMCVVMGCVAVLATAAAIAVPASAQTAAAAPAVTIGGGAGVANPFHSDFSFTPPVWQASVRRHAGRHLVIEGFVAGWQHTSASELLDVLVTGPSGPIGRVDRIAEESRRTVGVFGVNVLGRTPAGRLSFYGGGGPGYWLHDRRFTQTTSGCDASSGHLCGTNANTFSSSSLTVQGVVGVDGAVTSRLIAYGEYQAVFPVSDPGIGHGAFTAGIRLALR